MDTHCQSIPKYLVDRPREQVSIANSAELTEIEMADHRLFSTLIHKCGYKEKYMTNFGDEDSMPHYTCWD